MLNNKNKIVDLNKLRIFAAIYEFNGVSKAADILHVTPSAISQTLNQLETELGFKLFQRISKKLYPTEQAKNLYLVFQKCTDDLKTCLDTIDNRKSEPSGTLRIGAPPEYGSRQVVQVASEFFKFKHAKFELEFGLPDNLLGKVLNQELDFAFCDGGPYLKKYSKLVVHQTVFKEEAVLVCSKEFYQKWVKGVHTFEHLSSLPHSDYRPDRKVLNLWYQYHFNKIPSEFDLRLSGSQVNAMIQAALMGIGLVFIPTQLIESELKSKKLVIIPTKKSPYINPIVLVQKADKVPSLLEKTFISKFL
ncbi:MAG: LysR family transcriptional regulator [Bdellovibrionota bacterium]